MYIWEYDGQNTNMYMKQSGDLFCIVYMFLMFYDIACLVHICQVKLKHTLKPFCWGMGERPKIDVPWSGGVTGARYTQIYRTHSFNCDSPV